MTEYLIVWIWRLHFIPKRNTPFSVLEHFHLFDFLTETTTLWNSGLSTPVICVLSWLLTVKSLQHKVSGSCNKTGVWVRLLLTHLSLSALVVKEVERRGSSWQSSANTGGKGSLCCKPGKPVNYPHAHSHPSLPHCQLCFPEMTCSTPYQCDCLTSLLHWACTDLPVLPDPSVPLHTMHLRALIQMTWRRTSSVFFWELALPTGVGYC